MAPASLDIEYILGNGGTYQFGVWVRLVDEPRQKYAVIGDGRESAGWQHQLPLDFPDVPLTVTNGY